MAIEERMLDDAALVGAAQEGDDVAFAELFRRHYPTVRRICVRRMGSLVEGDEVAQAAFVRAYEHIHQCRGERRFGAWVQVIALRCGADIRRLRARATPTAEPVAGDAALGPNSCEDALLQAERTAQVHEVLAALPPRQREVIVARDLEERRPGEIAASLGLSLGAVDSLLLRARRRMATAWQAASIEHGTTSLQVTTASLATATAASDRRSVGRLLEAVGDAVGRASVRLAGAFGIVPTASPVTQQLGRLAVVALVASPMAVAAPALHARSGTSLRRLPASPGAVGGLPDPAAIGAPEPPSPGPLASPPSPAVPSIASPAAPSPPTAPSPAPPAFDASPPSLPSTPDVVSPVIDAVGTAGQTVSDLAPAVSTAVTDTVGSTLGAISGSTGSDPSTLSPSPPPPSSPAISDPTGGVTTTTSAASTTSTGGVAGLPSVP